jgi:minor extracellular serine protease Vpr
MPNRLLITFLLLLSLAGAAVAQQQRPQVHPLLQPLVDSPNAGIPQILRGPLGPRQGSRRLQGQEALDLFLRTTASRQQLEALGLKVRTLHDGRATVTAPVSALAALAARADVQAISLPTPVRPSLDKSVAETGAAYVRSQSAGVFSGRTGADVVVGVVDSGIDFDHPDFTDAAGNTRILYLWDQTGAGTAPAGYGYGTEWTSSDIDGGTCTEADDAAAWGHGTHVTGTAAGNGAAPDSGGASYKYTGMAPNAHIVFVKTDWSSTGIIDGMNYIFEKADALGLPAVINLSLGTQIGAHDGTDPMEEEIDTLVNAQAGRAVVVAAGNEGGDSIHAEINAHGGASVLGPDFAIPTYTKKAGAGNDYVYVVGYYPSTDNLTVQLWSPSGNYYTRNLGAGCYVDTAGSDGAVYLCNNSTSNFGQGTPDREIVVLIVDDAAGTPPADGTWHMALTGNTVAGSGEVDFWTLSSLGNNGDFASFTTHVDDEETLGIPGSANDAVTVGAYMTKTCWIAANGLTYLYTGSPSLGDIAEFSGRGPTRDGRSKPEVAAPGMGIVSSLAQEASASIPAGNLIDTWHMLLQGTSQATPHVTGAVALFFEEDPARTANDITSLLRSNAREDDWTESYDQAGLALGSTKNYVFGSGKLNVGSWAWSDPYETNDSFRTARKVLSGEVLSGYMDYAADYDYFDLETLASGDTVKVDLTSLPDNYKLNLMQTVGVLGSCPTVSTTSAASSDNAGTANESISYTGSAAHYIRVASSAGGYSGSSPYSLKAVITRPETSSVHNSTATAQVLPEHEEFKISGSIAILAQQDYYKLTARSGQTITASAGKSRTAQILDSTGAVLATSGVGPASYTAPIIILGVTRTYYVVVKNGAVGSYTLTTKVN